MNGSGTRFRSARRVDAKEKVRVCSGLSRFWFSCRFCIYTLCGCICSALACIARSLRCLGGSGSNARCCVPLVYHHFEASLVVVPSDVEAVSILPGDLGYVIEVFTWYYADARVVDHYMVLDVRDYQVLVPSEFFFQFLAEFFDCSGSHV